MSDQQYNPEAQAIVNEAQQKMSEIFHYRQKMSEIELQINEHQIVLDALKKLPEGRKAYKLVTGYLFETDAVGALEQTQAQLSNLKLLKQRTEELCTRLEQELSEFQAEHNLRFEN